MELCILDLEVASSLKDKLKQRIEKTFSDHMSTVRSYEYELLLQSVQCYCEDLLFKEWGIEIE